MRTNDDHVAKKNLVKKVDSNARRERTKNIRMGCMKVNILENPKQKCRVVGLNGKRSMLFPTRIVA